MPNLVKSLVGYVKECSTAGIFLFLRHTDYVRYAMNLVDSRVFPTKSKLVFWYELLFFNNRVKTFRKKLFPMVLTCVVEAISIDYYNVYILNSHKVSCRRQLGKSISVVDTLGKCLGGGVVQVIIL